MELDQDQDVRLVPIDGTSEQERARNILLAEDEEPVRNFVRIVLRPSGYCVTETTNGEEALSVFRANPDLFALLLTDCEMPVMDGPTLVRKAREIRPKLRVLMMSGRGRPSDLSLQEFVKKPFSSVDALIQAVRRALEDPLGREETIPSPP